MVVWRWHSTAHTQIGTFEFRLRFSASKNDSCNRRYRDCIVHWKLSRTPAPVRCSVGFGSQCNRRFSAGRCGLCDDTFLGGRSPRTWSDQRCCFDAPSVGRLQLIHVHPRRSVVLEGDSVSECKRQTTNAIVIISACDPDCVSFRCSGPRDSGGEHALTASHRRLRKFQRVTRNVHHGNRIVGVPV